MLRHPGAKPLLFVLCLLPAGWLFYGAWTDTLGANPAEALIRATGDWTLRLLCITLAITPLRQAFNATSLARFRRMLGLFTFFYGVLHFLGYGWLDQGFDVEAIVQDIAKRPFILVGTATLLVMLPLAATSFNRAIKALGAARCGPRAAGCALRAPRCSLIVSLLSYRVSRLDSLAPILS